MKRKRSGASVPIRRLFAMPIALALVSCVSWDPVPETASGQPVAEVARPVAPAPDSAPGNTTVLAPAPMPPAAHLLEQSRRDAAAGDLTAACANVERALRIDPGNPWLLVELAKLRLLQGRADQSDALAERARVLAPGDVTLMTEAWRASAAARTALGDAAGADRARREQQALVGSQ